MSTEQNHPPKGPDKIAGNLWRMVYPLSRLGNEHGRVVTIIRLTSGKLIVHSTAPFSAQDVAAMTALGEPGWLVEANLLHDTFMKEGHNAFPDIPYLAPTGFAKGSGLEIAPLIPAPAEWQGEVKVTLIEGMPLIGEHAILHQPSRTLIVGDLLFNFDEHQTAYQWFLQHVAMGLHHHPDMNRLVAALVADKELFAGSIREVLAWDFDRLIVGHKEMIETGAKPAFKAAVQRAFPDLEL